MKKRLINLASVSPTTPRNILEELARSTACVCIFSTAQNREVGYCDRYWLDGDHLWSEAHLVDDAAEDSPGVHAEAIIALKGSSALLCAVALTSMPRGMLQSAAVGKPFIQAVRDALEAGGFRRQR